jgi:pimeloyl-ACP methyl ester carboxylesterase
VRSWDPQLRGLTDQYRVIVYDAGGMQAKRPSISALAPQLRRLEMPVLLMVGEHDEACIPVRAFMARTIRGAAHHVLPGVGHLTNLEAPQAVNYLVAEVLGSHLTRAL